MSDTSAERVCEIARSRLRLVEACCRKDALVERLKAQLEERCNRDIKDTQVIHK